jgi:diguanylate cyclase
VEAALSLRFLVAPRRQLAVIVAIALLGMAGAIATLQNPYALLCILGLTALGLVQVALGETRVRDDGASVDSRKNGRVERAPETRESRFDRELAAALKLIQTHLVASGQYSESLVAANRSLHVSASPEKIRAITRALVEANEKMRRETTELSQSLEKSRQQVAELNSRLIEAEQMGMRDPLTDLANRRSFDANLTKEIAEARARGTPMCLIMADLDHFKKINDNFGHPFGDRVLQRFAELLTRNIKGRDTAARIGGEEFAILLPQTTLAAAAVLVEQIRSKLEAQQWKNVQSGQQFSGITASFGIAGLDGKEDAQSLIKRADALLYDAKRGGRNRVVREASA